MGAKALVKLDPNKAKMLMEGGSPDGPSLFKLDATRDQLGRADSLRYHTLRLVLDEKYDQAIQCLKDYLQTSSPYPDFISRITRFVNHAIDLVHAIKAKRNFPGIHSLTRSKQFELREKFREHFDELQFVLSRIEKVENNLRINDVRSTLYVVRALWMATMCILFVALLMDIMGGLGLTTSLVAGDLIDKGVAGLFNLVGF